MKSYDGSSHKSQVGYIPGENCVDDAVALCYPMYDYDNPWTGNPVLNQPVKWNDISGKPTNIPILLLIIDVIYSPQESHLIASNISIISMAVHNFSVLINR